MRDPITCPLSGYQDYTDNRDLDSNIHRGFYLIGKDGKPGKTMYFMMIWHSSGHCTIYHVAGDRPGRWVNGDSKIQIHFHDNS